jgi:hypothetical protein
MEASKGYSLMEIPDKFIELELKLYRDKIIQAKKYAGTPEGRQHEVEYITLRSLFLRLGMLTNSANKGYLEEAEDELKYLKRADN